MSPSPLRDLIRSPAGIVLVLLWLVTIGYGFVSPSSVFVYFILPLGVLGVVALLFLFYRLVVAVEHIAYESE
ncbi:hypothetical protein [Natrinema salsiterrestre]|uniref:Uncharacterized protein n=1 Tax=Natrinema salsiterrestre TaxID=2950540 RepID=A0A9Q4L305_9EURY|nr:hypothetical protein [Natrinema salsiterrestre]MDF9746419.1 hypothetical protein [Natrinema salsiterrestre]